MRQHSFVNRRPYLRLFLGTLYPIYVCSYVLINGALGPGSDWLLIGMIPWYFVSFTLYIYEFEIYDYGLVYLQYILVQVLVSTLIPFLFMFLGRVSMPDGEMGLAFLLKFMVINSVFTVFVSAIPIACSLLMVVGYKEIMRRIRK